MIAAAIKGHSSSDMGTPDTKWYYFIASESCTTGKTQDNLSIAGADIILCGTKKGAVDILSQVGQIAAPLKPTGAPRSLKLEATIREDKKKRFKFSGDGTEVIVSYKSRGKRGGKGGGGSSGVRELNNSSARSQTPLKGSVETSSDALRVQWCNSIFSKLFKEFQVEGGLSLSELGTLASALRPVGGDSLRLEASLSEDPRFILIRGREGTFAKLRGGRR
jgi:hypothetical protein